MPIITAYYLVFDYFDKTSFLFYVLFLSLLAILYFLIIIVMFRLILSSLVLDFDEKGNPIDRSE